jgi:2,4-dienoyl-CoA reductase-like NADH-dependent reductase (Old Yellow Enzyme family)/thioredoxin reductase
MEKLEKLFEPGRIGTLELKNRIIMAPLGNGFLFATKPDGYMTDRHLAFYEARARGGVGMIQLSVSALGRPYATGLVFGPGLLSIVDDEHAEAARAFTDAIHAHGTKVSFQITHHGAVIARNVAARPPVEYPELMRVVAPTGRRDPDTGFETHSLTTDEIYGIIEAFGQAARRGVAAGFDAVRIQGCHGYLIHQFLSPRTNQRTDEYGGSLENRSRFGIEITRRVRREVGPDYPIISRMNGDDFLEGGITLDDAVQHARLFVDAGADALDISSGPFETHHWQFPGMHQPFAALVPLAARIKQAVSVPIITAGKLDAIHAERTLREGSADFVQIGRTLMADPNMPNKAREGRVEDIRPCIYCLHCQNPEHRAPDGASQCSVNMAMGRELEYRLEPAAKPKKVVVVGGGTAGMEAARTLAERGHSVSLYEEGEKLGGQWNILAAYRPEVESILRYQARGLKQAGVEVHMNHAIDTEEIGQLSPDAVVLATGANPATLEDIRGLDGPNVVQALDVLSGEANIGDNVIVIGGRLVGLDTALFLAERGKNVSLMSRSQVARGVAHNLQLTFMEKLIKAGVRLYPHTVPDSVTPRGVNAWWDAGRSAREKVFAFFPADTVVLAVGADSEASLAAQLGSKVPEVHVIGDAVQVGDVFDAIHAGSDVGRAI